LQVIHTRLSSSRRREDSSSRGREAFGRGDPSSMEAGLPRPAKSAGLAMTTSAGTTALGCAQSCLRKLYGKLYYLIYSWEFARMQAKVQIIFYSMYGHIYRMAQAVAEGVKEVNNAEVEIFRVAELVPAAALEKSGAKEAQKLFEHIPIMKPEHMVEADAYIFGTPTRFGNMCAQMRNFLDQLGGLWMKNTFVNKIGSVFTSTGTQHGGQETTITSFHTTLLHLGMLVVGVPYSETKLMDMNEVSGGTPYGASTMAGDGKRQPTENELAIAQFQGKHVAEIALALKYGKNHK